MKMKREMPLSEALDEIADRVQQLKSEGAARVNGYEVKLDEPVMLEIESEAEKGKAELEFEIKWEAGKKRGRGGRRLLLGAAARAPPLRRARSLPLCPGPCSRMAAASCLRSGGGCSRRQGHLVGWLRARA